jgi:tetrahydromethanopterin S-methyltransferase subunit F
VPSGAHRCTAGVDWLRYRVATSRRSLRCVGGVVSGRLSGLIVALLGAVCLIGQVVGGTVGWAERSVSQEGPAAGRQLTAAIDFS